MIACMKTHNEQHCLQLITMHDLCGEADGRQCSQQEQLTLKIPVMSVLRMEPQGSALPSTSNFRHILHNSDTRGKENIIPTVQIKSILKEMALKERRNAAYAYHDDNSMGHQFSLCSDRYWDITTNLKIHVLRHDVNRPYILYG